MADRADRLHEKLAEWHSPKEMIVRELRHMAGGSPT